MTIKGRHRINIWITEETYNGLHALKKKTGISLNVIAQVAVADKVTRLLVNEGLYRNSFDKLANSKGQAT